MIFDPNEIEDKLFVIMLSEIHCTIPCEKNALISMPMCAVEM